ncbi:hypothetical protein MMC16_005978 [Acarospora aff. strigata]|nr:hypothetical protein [Acarospora aff. strigata]
MTGHLRQMSSWILSAAFLTSSLVSSLDLPERGRSVSARHLQSGQNVQCGPYYGSPSSADCETVADNIRAFRIGIFGNTDAYNEHYDEFIIRGGEEQHAQCELHWYTPFYWKTGTCIGALFVDQSINGATADVERWLDIYETAQHVVNVCVTRHGFGGKNRGDLGENNPMHHALLI